MDNEIIYNAQGDSFTVRTGEGAFLGCAGRAWAVIDGQGGAACVTMGQSRYYTLSEGMEAAGVTRPCPAAERAQRRLNDQAFAELRATARAFLSEYGVVRGGVASCGEFIAC